MMKSAQTIISEVECQNLARGDLILTEIDDSALVLEISTDAVRGLTRIVYTASNDQQKLESSYPTGSKLFRVEKASLN